MGIILADSTKSKYDLIVVGSGFGSLFFLKGYLNKRPNDKILILEWGQLRSRDWQLENQTNSTINFREQHTTSDGYDWNYTIGFGGGSNCWWAQTPRFHPTDFSLKTNYGIGNDWPISYDDLEPYYSDAEYLMSVSGPNDNQVIFPRSTNFPQPEHKFTSVDKIMKAAQPNSHFAMPTARARISTEKRNSCCANFSCNLCPMGAKFMAVNDFDDLLDIENVDIAMGCKVTHLDKQGTNIKTVHFETNNKSRSVDGDLVVLGANAIHSPYILLKSNILHPYTGVGIHEQLGVEVEADLDGVNNFDGSTATSAINLSLYDGSFRSEYSGALIYFENYFKNGLRRDYNRWRQIVPMMVVTEELAQEQNKVVIGDEGQPHIIRAGHSEYAEKGMQKALEKLPKVLEPLPVENIRLVSKRATEAHIQGSLRMGDDVTSSVVDANLVHHSVRNLVIVGSSVFASCSCANPSLTVAALSLRSADRLI